MLLFLALLCCFLLCRHQGFEIALCNQEFLSIFFYLSVLCISGFLSSHQFGVLRIQILYFRELLHSQLIKDLLGGFMKRDLFPVRFKELFTVGNIRFGQNLSNVPVPYDWSL